MSTEPKDFTAKLAKGAKRTRACGTDLEPRSEIVQPAQAGPFREPLKSVGLSLRALRFNCFVRAERRVLGRRGTGRGRWASWLGVAALLGVLCAPLPRADAGQAGPTAASPPARARVAVLKFAGTGGPDGLGEALGQVMQDGLRQIRGVELVGPAALVESAGRLALSLDRGLSDEDLLRLGQSLRLRGLVAGSYGADGDTLKVQARLVEFGAPGRVVRGEETTGPLAGFVPLQARVLREVLSRLAIRPSEHDDRRMQAIFTEPSGSLEAYTLYARGVWQSGLGSK